MFISVFKPEFVSKIIDNFGSLNSSFILLIFLYASGEFQNDSKIFASFKMDEKLEYGFWYHIFMLFYIRIFDS